MELYKMGNYVGKYFIIAVLLAAVIKIMVPADYIARFLGQDTFLSVLLTTRAGIPFFVCGGAAIAVVQQLEELGMGKGAMLAFFISGPATKISTLILIHSAFSQKVFFHSSFGRDIRCICLRHVIQFNLGKMINHKPRRNYKRFLLILAAAIFKGWDFATSSDQFKEEGTYRYESEFDGFPPPETPVKVAVVTSDYPELQSQVSRSSPFKYDQVEGMVRKAIELQGGLDGVVRKGDKVLIKPNLIERNSPSGEGTNTDDRVVKALIKIIHAHTGGDVEITVTEGIPRQGYVNPISYISTTSSW